MGKHSKNPRRGKKRASAACLMCRSRKVRCNLTTMAGLPCSNCIHDEIPCMLPMSRRQKNAKKLAAKYPREMTIEKTEGANVTTISFKCNGLHLTDHSRLVRSMIEQDGRTNTPTDNIKNKIESYLATCNTDASVLGSSSSTKDTTNPGFDPDTNIRPVNWLAPPCTHQAQLRSMFTHLPPHLDQIDLAYLSTHDALSIPSGELQFVLLNNYVTHIHPHLPFLNVTQFLNTLRHHRKQEFTGKSPSQMSFLLFQAVMFAGSTVTDSESLKKAGYSSRNDAECALFRRVRLLYDFDFCKDRLSILQSLVLMSYTRTVTPDRKDSSHWLGLAISMSFGMGLHRKSSLNALEEQKLERRLWWCIFFLDRTAALSSCQEVCQSRTARDNKRGSARSMRCRQEDCTVMEDWYLASETVRQAEESGGERNRVQATRATSSPQRWQFSVGPGIPAWPQRYDETSSTSGFAGQPLNASTGSAWDLFEDGLWDATAWERWDEAGESECPAMVSSFAASLPPGPASTSNSQLRPSLKPEPDSVATVALTNDQQVPFADHHNIPRATYLESILDPSSLTIGKGNRATAYGASKAGRDRKSPILLRRAGKAANVSAGRRSLASIQETRVSQRWSHFASSHRTISSRPSSDPRVSAPTPLPPSADPTEPPPRSTNKQYEKDTERQYRSRLNDGFSMLLNAIPQALVVSATGVSGNGQEERAVTKMEILDLAKTHITSLETAQSELKEESLLLRGQVALSESIFPTLRGQTIG